MAGYPEDFEVIEREAERIAKELDIPPCPVILARFNQEFHASEPDLRTLAALIGTDVGLSATILKTVNSPFYGLVKKANGVEQALSILGLRACANIVSGLLLRRAFPAASGPALEQFWDSTMRIAGLAAEIASRLKNVDRDSAHTYVLFRDCGMLVMLRKFPEYADIMEQGATLSGGQLTCIEDAQFKFNHARVACALARSWSLPETLCGAILHHHEFALMARRTTARGTADRRLVAFGMLAEQIAALRLDRGLCPDWAAGERFVLDTLDIKPDDIVRLAEDLPAVAA
jgi:HD-like signal output (HDOD) protein